MDGSEFTPYVDGTRKIRRHPLGYVIVVPTEDAASVVPIACPKCRTILRSHRDEEAYSISGCCDRCALEKAETPEEVKQYLSRRPGPSIVLDFGTRA